MLEKVARKPLRRAVVCGGFGNPPCQTVRLPGGVSVEFAIDAVSERCLLDRLNELGASLSELHAIQSWEASCER
jgi:hypothetical protein